MFNMTSFQPNLNTPKKGIDTHDEIPDSLDVYFRTEEQFLPPGKDFEDLTEGELDMLKLRYKYDIYKPGQYQGITGFGKMIN